MDFWRSSVSSKFAIPWDVFNWTSEDFTHTVDGIWRWVLAEVFKMLSNLEIGLSGEAEKLKLSRNFKIVGIEG